MNDLIGKVRSLSDPFTYGPAVGHVDVCETHMSWVFLTESRVYKLKKPIVRPHLDFGTMERRRHFCEEEVRLNRRLAERTYLGVVPLRRRASGAFALGGDGPIATGWSRWCGCRRRRCSTSASRTGTPPPRRSSA
jgi:uncharacterized protein